MKPYQSLASSLDSGHLHIQKDSLSGHIFQQRHDSANALPRSKSHGQRTPTIVLDAIHVRKLGRHDNASNRPQSGTANALVESGNGSLGGGVAHGEDEGHSVVVGGRVDGVSVGSFEAPLDVYPHSLLDRHVASAGGGGWSLAQVLVGHARGETCWGEHAAHVWTIVVHCTMGRVWLGGDEDGGRCNGV